jgi:hypothetical protein
MMNEIYSYAQKVLVWLGPDTGTASEAIRSINVMYKECQRIKDGFQRLTASSMSGDNRIVARDFPASCNLPALLDFYAERWFTRIWPVQEVVLAREAIVIQGKEAIPWENVAIVGRWMSGQNDCVPAFD